MKLKKNNKNLIVLLLICCMLLSFVSCNKETPLTAEQVEEQKFEEIVKEANEAGSMWELLCRLFPNYVIYKSFTGFAYHRVNTELALNTYDWSSLAGTYKGIDVSTYQGSIDWEQVAGSGIEYAFVRVGYRGYTEGKLQEDKRYKNNIEGALKNDVSVGAYFVTKALTEDEAIEEAEYFMELVKPYNITWPLVIDIEPTSNLDDRTGLLTAEQRTKNVVAFCNTIKEAGYTPMIYGGVGTFMNYLEFEKLEGIDKWFAQYFNQPWLRYEFKVWQASDEGSVPGIKGNVDINYSIVSYDEK